MADFATPHSLAKRAIPASFALPASGAAVTETFSAFPPSGSSSSPPNWLRFAFGATLRRTRTPAGLARNGTRYIIRPGMLIG